MTPEIYAGLATSLKQADASLDELHASIVQEGSTWSMDQLKLFLVCMDGVEVASDGSVRLGEQSPKEALLEAIVTVVDSRGGKPIPAAQVLRLLPGGFVTSEAQVKALAKASDDLDIFGPGLLRIKEPGH